MTANATLHVRYEGTDTALGVAFAPARDDAAAVAAGFAAAHRQRYGFVVPDKRPVIEMVALELVGAMDRPPEPAAPTRTHGEPPLAPLAQTTLFSGGRRHAMAVFQRAALRAGDHIDGAAMIIE